MPKVKKAKLSSDFIAAVLKAHDSSYAYYNKYRLELDMSWSSYRRLITGEYVSENLVSRIMSVASESGVYKQAQRSVDVAYLREINRLLTCMEESDDPDKSMELLITLRAYWRKNRLPIRIALERLERRESYEEVKGLPS